MTGCCELENKLLNFHIEEIKKLNIIMTKEQSTQYIKNLINKLNNMCPRDNKPTSNCKCDPCECDPCNC